jgi:hypothetical protein
LYMQQLIDVCAYLGGAPQKVTLACTAVPAAAETPTATLTGAPTTGAAVCTCRLTLGPAAVTELGAVMAVSTSATVCPAVARLSKATAPGSTHRPCMVPAMLLPVGLPRITSPWLLISVDTQPAAVTWIPVACNIQGNCWVAQHLWAVTLADVCVHMLVAVACNSS